MVSDLIEFRAKLDKNESSDQEPDSEFWMFISQSETNRIKKSRWTHVLQIRRISAPPVIITN
jgi:hypothetical protein